MVDAQDTLTEQTSTTVTTYSRLRRRLVALLQDLRDTRDQGQRATTDASHIPMFKGMLRNLDKEYNNFDSVWTELCNLDEEEGEHLLITEEDKELRSRARRYFCEASAFAEALVSTSRISVLGVPLSSSTQCSHSRQKTSLPFIPIPSFDGQRTNWRQFKDVFDPLVNKEPTLTDAERFYYLSGALKGPAAALIAKLPASGDNYKTAWDLLDKTYDKPRILASNYIEQILNLKKLPYKPSTEVLQTAIAEISKTVAAFQKLDIPDRADFLIFHLTIRCLHPQTQEDFELAREDKPFPKYDDLVAFLYKQCEASEVRNVATPSTQSLRRSPPRSRKQFAQYSPRPFDSLGVQVDSNPPSNLAIEGVGSSASEESVCNSLSQSCFLCKGKHSLYACEQFKTLSVEERHHMIQGWKGCQNCLSTGHPIDTCKSRLRCRHCHSKHHTLLHREKRAPTASGSPSGQAPHVASCNLAPIPTHSSLAASLMGTVVTQISDVSGRLQPVRLVLDSASHVSFMTKSLAERCGLQVSPLDITIHGVTNLPLTGLMGQAKCFLHPDPSSHLTLETRAVVVDNIMSPQPRALLDKKLYEPYLKYNLADREFYMPNHIEFLLGCDLFGEVLTGEILTISPNMPRLIGTVFGHTVIGRLGDIGDISTCVSTVTEKSDDQRMNSELQRFWALDDPPPATLTSKENSQMEDWFERTHSRLPSGRYVVMLPFKGPPPDFPGHHIMALKRLRNIENKLSSRPAHRKLYHEFMNEYLALDHMELASSPGSYCIPHHGVFKGDPLKVRVVFDASARSKNGSLNENLDTGPKLQNDLSHILINFRFHPIAFTVDVVKMYRQIVVHPSHRSYQHVLWRDDPSKAVQEYQMRTLPFGLSCAPYLALRVLKQLVSDEGDAFPLASLAITRDTYVDDIVTGASNVHEALQLQKELIQLFGKGAFPLSKWASNCQDILAMPQGPSSCRLQQAPLSLDLEPERFIKILGLHWDPQKDVFCYTVDLPTPVFTKRGTLSLVAKLYDPLGFVGPVILLAKLIVQEAWKRALEWDSNLPSDLCERWQGILNELPMLRELRIPRQVYSPQAEQVYLVTFADASEAAYCATVYLRTQQGHTITSNLLIARTKLAPVKQMTIPRLELCAALLAARLSDSLSTLQELIKQPVERVFFSDSMVVLGWLQRPNEKMPVFVANRVGKILEITRGKDWLHVRSEENPSDIGSRGVLPIHLNDNTLWFHGPPWLQQIPESWPRTPIPSETDLFSTAPEGSHVALTVTSDIQSESFFSDWMLHFSSWTRMTRSMAYALRFINNSRHRKEGHVNGRLSLDEVQHGTAVCCKLTQALAFFHNRLPQEGRTIPKHLLPLAPFVDPNGLLRVGGRLEYSELPYEQKHPILLPKESKTSHLIVDYYHRLHLHPGTSLLTALIRQRFWIVGLRSLVRQTTRTCVQCQRGAPKISQPIMGNLPITRFHEGRAFHHVGTDFAGPFMVRDSLRRKPSTSKAYFCIFICLSTKAVHLETVSALSTQAFIAALERFIGRRGLPGEVFSDNGTNFVGAARTLNEWWQWSSDTKVKEAIQDYAARKEFKWTFIPPHAPHFGGLWEAGVKSAKRLLQAHYRDSLMTFEEFTTLLVRIEAILNSRPLCPLSSDPNDLDYLSPGHFLIGSTLTAVPERCLINSTQNNVQRWERVSRIAQHFWCRWRKEYLSNLQTRAKWYRPSPNIQVGDLVFLQDDRVNRLQWPRGRVSAVYPGKDQVVRVVDVHTVHGTYRRPVTQVAPLLLPGNQGT